MKKTFYIVLGILFSLFVSSCTVNDDIINVPPQNTNDSYILQTYDLWEVDHSKTTGPASASVPFLDRAITLSFYNGVLYANNNFSGLGYTGNGYGIDVGVYELGYNSVRIDHDFYERIFLEIIYFGQNQIKLYDRNQNLTYTLYGYNKYNYDYDYVFYNNIDYFLQEFSTWRKVYTSAIGALNPFDNENILSFDTQGNIFYSSFDAYNTPESSIIWDYKGVYNVSNTNNLKTKVLRLDYPDGVEMFNLTVINDNRIRLVHTSGTIYEFEGYGYIQFLRPGLKTLTNKITK